MDVFKAIAWVILTIICFAVAALFTLAKYGHHEVRFACSGVLANEPTKPKLDLFLKLDLYAPWMVWADSAGSAWSEIPLQEYEYYPDISSNGDMIGLTSSNSKRRGYMSTLSNAIRLDTNEGSFEGRCKRIQSDF